MVRRHGRGPGEVGQHGGQRLDPGVAVVGLGVLGGGVGDPGGVADEQHRRLDPGAGQDAGVVARGGRQHRCAAEPVGEAVPEVAVERHQRRPGLLDRLGARGGARPPPTTARTSASSAPRASSQARTRDGIALVPLGATSPGRWWRPRRGRWRPRGRPARRRPAGASGRRGPPAGWCRRGWPRRRGRAATARAARCRGRRRPRRPRRPGRGPARRAARRRCRSGAASRRRGPSCSGSCPAARIASASVVPSASVQPPGPVGVEGAGEQPRPGAGDAEPGALLVGEADHRRAAAPGRRPARAAGRPRRTR